MAGREVRRVLSGVGACLRVIGVFLQENQPPSIFGAMTGKAMPAAVARLANVRAPTPGMRVACGTLGAASPALLQQEAASSSREPAAYLSGRLAEP